MVRLAASILNVGRQGHAVPVLPSPRLDLLVTLDVTEVRRGMGGRRGREEREERNGREEREERNGREEREGGEGGGEGGGRGRGEREKKGEGKREEKN